MDPREPRAAAEAGQPAADLLRLTTAGSVDNGKSTLVGRLLYDSKSVLADQLEAVEAASRARGGEGPDLALLTDGLRAEREQGITIDVAYRYFATARRRFVLADTPGHVEYTRNMVTGASTAQLMIILLDARQGIVEQTRRHTAVAGLLRVPHVVLAVNKMDLVGFDERRFAEICDEYGRMARALGVADFTAIPLSALLGDNVVERSAQMDWYGGPELLRHLEEVPVQDDRGALPGRFPVQCALSDGGRAAGMVAAGCFAVGDEVVSLPSGRRSRIAAIDRLGVPAESAGAGESVALRLEGAGTAARGDLLAPVGAAPALAETIGATVCHLGDKPLRVGQSVLLRHTTRQVPAVVTELSGRLDLATLRREGRPRQLATNDIATIVVRAREGVAADLYEENRTTGSFLLIDPEDGSALSAGMVERLTATTWRKPCCATTP